MKILLKNRKEERLFRVPEISIDDLKLKFEEYNMTEDLDILVLSNLVDVLDDVRESYKVDPSKPVMDNELNSDYDNYNLLTDTPERWRERNNVYVDPEFLRVLNGRANTQAALLIAILIILSFIAGIGIGIDYIG